MRAWLTTVLAPMGASLAVERDRVARRNWSFRGEAHDFEFLSPIRKMVAVQYSANLDQFVRHHPTVRNLVDAHDRALDDLRVATRSAYDRFVQSEAFRSLARGVHADNKEWNFLAEYVVNGLRDLASYYSLQELWNREAVRFLALREEPTLAPAFRALDEAGRAFQPRVESLSSEIAALQAALADAYKLPPVDPVDTRA